MGINVGATIAPLICGYAGQRIDWHLGFALSGVGMTFGVIQFWFGRRHLAEAGLHPVPAANPAEAKSQRRLLRSALLGVVAIGAAMAFVHLTGILPLTPTLLVNSAGVVLLAIVVALFAWMLLGGDWTPVERKRLGAILVLFIAASLFWSAFEQAGSSLSLFADRSSDNVILHFAFPASWYQSLNSLFIVAVAPLLAWAWVRLGSRQPSSPAKFALGLVFVGLGYVVLVFGALLSAHGAKVSPLFLVVTYLMHTFGELCISPVGLSAITKLAPARVGSFMMGVWFISISIGDYLGARLTSFYGALPVPTLFGIVAGFSLVAGIAMFMIARPVTRLMGGVRWLRPATAGGNRARDKIGLRWRENSTPTPRRSKLRHLSKTWTASKGSSRNSRRASCLWKRRCNFSRKERSSAKAAVSRLEEAEQRVEILSRRAGSVVAKPMDSDAAEEE